MKIFLFVFFISLLAIADCKDEVLIDKVETGEFGHCFIRQATYCTDSAGVRKFGPTYHRWSVEPEGDLSKFDARVKSICKAAWTPEIIKKFKAQQEKNKAALNLSP